MLRAAGAKVSEERAHGNPVDPVPGKITVEPAAELSLPDLTVAGDISSAAFVVVAALLVSGSDVELLGVGVNPTRTGLLTILERMGAEIEWGDEREEGGEPIADLRVRASQLHATEVGGAEVPLAIDELPLVALAACFAEGTTTIRDAEELRRKESDRVETVTAALTALGAEVEGTPDGMVITGTGGLRGGTVFSHGDHRIAMLGAVAGLASREGVEVVGMDAAAVSYPGFEADLGTLLRGGA
jgi:3-phosphoshikimate 1-carboxyvinyltransferase